MKSEALRGSRKAIEIARESKGGWDKTGPSPRSTSRPHLTKEHSFGATATATGRDDGTGAARRVQRAELPWVGPSRGESVRACE